MILRGSLLRSLSQRLRARAAGGPTIRRSSTSPSRPPSWSVRMMRSGTTLLQRILASDRRLCLCVRLGGRRAGTETRVEPGRRRSQGRRRRSPGGAGAAVTRRSSLPSTPPTCTRPRRRSSSWPARSCPTSPKRRATSAVTGRGWTTSTFAPAYRWLRRMLQLLQWQKRRRGEPVRPFVLKTPPHLGYLDTLLAESFPTPTSSTPAIRWRSFPRVRPSTPRSGACIAIRSIVTRWGGSGWSGWVGPAIGPWQAGPHIPSHQITDVRFTDSVAGSGRFGPTHSRKDRPGRDGRLRGRYGGLAGPGRQEGRSPSDAPIYGRRFRSRSRSDSGTLRRLHPLVSVGRARLRLNCPETQWRPRSNTTTSVPPLRPVRTPGRGRRRATRSRASTGPGDEQPSPAMRGKLRAGPSKRSCSRRSCGPPTRTRCGLKVTCISRLEHPLDGVRIPGSRWGIDNPDSVYQVVPDLGFRTLRGCEEGGSGAPPSHRELFHPVGQQP